MQYGFVIDQTACIGCHACTVACKTEHDVPLGVNRTWVKYIETGTWPDTKRAFSVLRCNHCSDAPCVSICPTGALFRRDDGIVDFDTRLCIGCKSCMQACPYDALYIDPLDNTAQKCNYCVHRVEVGLEPACVVVCPEGAIISGDLNDPTTPISRFFQDQPVGDERLLQRSPEQRTRPNLWYKGADKALTLMTRIIDFAFAMFYVRQLGPVGTGQFAFVVALYGVFELISRFGLDTLLTRDVARDKALSSRYLTNVCALRTLIWAGTTIAMVGVALGFRGIERITDVEVVTIVIFSLAMLFAGWSDALSAAFHAWEKMEYPASLTTVSTLLRSGLGALVLLLGWGLPGIAWVAVVTVVMQVVWFYVMLRRTLFHWHWEWDWPLQRWMLANGFPFMLNSLLATVLLNIDIWVLRLMSGEVASGLYSVALKYRFGITLIPSMFNFAIFPLFSRYARQTGDGLMGAYRLSIRLLTLVSVPIAFGTTLLAKPLVLVVGGAEFLGIEETFEVLGRSYTFTGGSHLALQVVIWTIVFNFINAVTQYVLIALDQQRYLTKAFIAVVVFNAVGNLLLIPVFGYTGAAVVTILSEMFLFIPFQAGIRRHLGTVDWMPLIWKPTVGLAVMVALSAGLGHLGWSVWIIFLAASAAYMATLYATGEVRYLMERLPLSNLKALIKPAG